MTQATPSAILMLIPLLPFTSVAGSGAIVAVLCLAGAFALLGLRALYFLVSGLLDRLVHLGYGLAAILALIGVKLVLHWAHTVWPSVPEVPTAASLGVIVGVLVVVSTTSLLATRRDSRRAVAVNPAGR